MKSANHFKLIIAYLLISANSYMLWSKTEGNLPKGLVIGIQLPKIINKYYTWNSIRFQAGFIVPLFKYEFIPILRNSNSVSLRFETNLSMQGSKWVRGEKEGITNTLYLNLPFVIRYQASNGFFGEAGLQPGCLIKAKDKIDGEKYDSYANLNKFDFGFPFGVGCEFNNNIGIGLRVTPGILTTIKTESDKYCNLVIAIRGTYTFKKKPKVMIISPF